MTYRVGIYLYPQVEVLDFAGPYEVFTTATRVHGRRRPGTPAPFEVFTFARSAGPVTARAGLSVLPDATLDAAAPDVLLIPGGVVDAELGDAALVAWIAATAGRCELVASVCTGAFLLAKAGLLTGRTATTHWEDTDDLAAAFPAVTVDASARWVDEGPVVTSAGIAAGIDMSLHLVARLAGDDLARATARQLDVPYRASSR